MTGGLRFVVYDHTRARRGWVQAGSPDNPVMVEARATLRHTRLSSAELTVDADHHLVPVLSDHGARVIVEYRPDDTAPWSPVMSGPVTVRRGEGSPNLRTYTIADDKRMLWGLLAWPSPERSIDAQDRVTHWHRTGPAETVAKMLIGANASRYGIPITVAPDQGRGDTVTIEARMDRIGDVLVDALDAAGLGITVLMADDGTGLTVDVYAKRVQSVPLSDRAGVIATQHPAYSDANPAATRVTIGAGGEDTARVFSQHIDTAREAEWVDTVEQFVDARDLTPGKLVVDGSFVDGLTEWATSGTQPPAFRIDPDEGASVRFPAGAGTLTQAAVATITPAGEPVGVKIRIKRAATVGRLDVWLVDTLGQSVTATWTGGDTNPNGTPDTDWTSVEGTITPAAGAPAVVRPVISTWQTNGVIDVTDIEYTAGTWIYPPLLAERAGQALAEAAPTASLSMELAETDHYRFGNAVQLGDIVTVSLAGGPLLSDTVTEVVIDHTGTGLLVTPVVGDRSSSPDHPDAQLAAVVGRALRTVHKLSTRR